ncbi:MAG: hypothetical protein L6262_07990 [Weeksellaceae bacterium]|nr:hypothetical protein [Weeksellaceae bacterium]
MKENWTGTKPIKPLFLSILFYNKTSFLTELGLPFKISGESDSELIPCQPNTFKTKEFADLTFAFMIWNGKVVSMKQKSGLGEYEIKKLEDEK